MMFLKYTNSEIRATEGVIIDSTQKENMTPSLTILAQYSDILNLSIAKTPTTRSNP